MGGKYYTWFKDENSESRALLYKLEKLEIFVLRREKKDDFYIHKWELTKKGKELVDNDNLLKELLKKRNLVEFYNKIINKIK